MVLALRAAFGCPNSILSNLSLLVQRKVTKRNTLRSARRLRRFPPFLARAGARQLVGRIIRGSTRTGARLKTPARAAVLGARYGEVSNPSQSLARVFFTPVWRAQASQPVPEKSRASCSSPRRVFLRPASWGARRDRREAQGAVAPSGCAFFSSLFFARAKKRDLPAVRKPQLAFESRAKRAQKIFVGQPPTSNTRAKPARQESGSAGYGKNRLTFRPRVQYKPLHPFGGANTR
jgi:hypothetical protein